MSKRLEIPISPHAIRELKVGDTVLLSGVMLTGRDEAHKWLFDHFVRGNLTPSPADAQVYHAIQPVLEGGVIYHCGPVVSGLESKEYSFVAAGPTTSIREEPYQGEIIRHFNLRGVIGKGGMGQKTLRACQETPAVYFHAVGGAAALAAACVEAVLGVFMLEFGVPEAMWLIRVRDFPVVVTMDSHGDSLHEKVRQHSRAVLGRLIE